MVKINKILFPCDLSEHAPVILKYVLSMSEKYDASVYLLHVVPDLNQWTSIFLPHPSLISLSEQALAGAKQIMDHMCEDHLEACQNYETMIVTGDPVQEILKVVESEKIDMVIMGTHGRKGLDHTLFGSVAENVVKLSPVPVLTVNTLRITVQE